MTLRLRYFALALYIFAPCVARCDTPVIDQTFIDIFTQTLNEALFTSKWEYNPDTGEYEELRVSVFDIGGYYGLGEFLDYFSRYMGATVGTGVRRQDIWIYLENNGYGYINWHWEDGGDPSPTFEWIVENPPQSVYDVPGLFDWIVNQSLSFPVKDVVYFDFAGNPDENVFGLVQAANLLWPKLNDALDKINEGNGGGVGGNGGGVGDNTIHIQIHGGVTNITRILTNHFDRATNHYNVVSNSLVTITNSVVIVTNQLEVALDYLKQIATNTQQDAIVTILQFMTNNWPDVNISFPDQSNDVQDVTNKLRVGRYTFRADMGPLIIPDRDFGDQQASRKWFYRQDEHGNYYLDGFADETQYLYSQLDNGEWEFGEVVTYTLQMIADKAQDIKNSLWILNHSFDTNSAPVDISELDSYKREVDSFVQGTQGTLESVFYNVELDDGVFTKFKNNFVAIFGTVGRGPPMLRGASRDGSTRQTVWTFYVGDQRWDISLDSTLYTSSRRLCRMAASMVWCVLLWIGFRKILIRAVYWLVKCIDWCLQVFGFQIKWLGTVEEFLKQLAGIGPGG